MRPYRRERPAAIGFLGRELRWMALGITTLVVLFLLISHLREQGAAGRLAAAQRPSDEPASAATIAKLPKPIGPTDEDEEEAEAADEEFQALSDGTLTLGPEEMVPYNRLVSWVNSQSFARLWARAKKNLAYTYLYDDPQPSPRPVGGARRGNPARPQCRQERRRHCSLRSLGDHAGVGQPSVRSCNRRFPQEDAGRRRHSRKGASSPAIS